MLVGSHVGLHDVAGAARELGAQVVQVHLSAPLQWRNPVPFLDSANLPVPVYAHAPYVANPVSSSPDVRARTVTALRAQLAEAARVGARGLVVHAGQAGDGVSQEEAVDRWLQTLGGLGPLPVPLLVENTATGACSPGHGLADLARLFVALDAAGLVGDGRVGLCLDTCHAWAAGWPHPEGMARAVVDATGRLDLVHLNDCSGDHGAGLDRHADLGCGAIGRRTLLAVAREAATLGCPAAVLEEPGGPDVVRRDLTSLRRALQPRPAGRHEGGVA